MFKPEYSDTEVSNMGVGASLVAKSSGAIELTLYDKSALVFHEDRFKLPMPPQCWEIKEDANIINAP